MLYWSYLWIIGMLGAYLVLPYFLSQQSLSKKRIIIIIISVSLVARMVPNLMLSVGAGYDIESYQIVSHLIQQGKDVYTHPDANGRHPYLPFQMYWFVFSSVIAEQFHLEFIKIVRLAAIIADIFIAVLLSQMMSTPEASLRAGLTYALNPVPILVSSYHGQFDAIPICFLLLSISTASSSPIKSGLWVGFGILDKSWPILAIPSLVYHYKKWSHRLVFMILSIIIPLIGVFIYCYRIQVYPITVVQQAINYNHGIGVWGYSYLARLLSIVQPDLTFLFRQVILHGRYITLTILVMVWVLYARKQRLEASILTVFVTFFVVTHAFSIQYLMWLVPFAILNQSYKWLKYYTLAACFYMFLVYSTLILEMHITKLMPWPQADYYFIIPTSLPVWLVTIGWLSHIIPKNDQSK